MGRNGYRRFEVNHEFDLDLAPLLAVMVKLVPVLLLSSAFVQLSIIETELPQLVQEAVQQQEEKTQARLMVEMDPAKGFEIVLRDSAGQEKTFQIPMAENKWDFRGLHAKFVEIKSAHPEIFKMEFSPASTVLYQDVIKATDEARQARDPKMIFPIRDKNSQQIGTTNYMFPEVTFSNMLEG